MTDQEQARAPAAEGRRHRVHQRPARPHRVSVRLSQQEYAVVVAAARAEGAAVAAFLGQVVVAAAQLDLAGNDPGAGVAVDGLRDLQRELFAVRRLLHRLLVHLDRAAAAAASSTSGPAVVMTYPAIVGRLDAVIARVDRRLR